MAQVAGLMKIGGGVYSAIAARRAGQAAKESAFFEAGQLRQQAGEEIAASQRQALEERRRSDLLQSRALAVAAASGGGASDPTVTSIISRIEGEGEYRSAIALYEGSERARRLRAAASGKIYEGDQTQKLADQRSYAYLLGAGSEGTSLYSKYGGSREPGLVEEMVPRQFSLSNPAYG